MLARIFVCALLAVTPSLSHAAECASVIMRTEVQMIPVNLVWEGPIQISCDANGKLASFSTALRNFPLNINNFSMDEFLARRTNGQGLAVDNREHGPCLATTAICLTAGQDLTKDGGTIRVTFPSSSNGPVVAPFDLVLRKQGAGYSITNNQGTVVRNMGLLVSPLPLPRRVIQSPSINN